MVTMVTKAQLLKALIETKNGRGAWNKAIKLDAIFLLKNNETLKQYRLPQNTLELEKILLNGAYDWREYSLGGCALICDTEIAHHYCNPTELKITHYGLKEPNHKENWLELQARGLYQSFQLIKKVFFQLKGEN